jgi:hypothetical protein
MSISNLIINGVASIEQKDNAGKPYNGKILTYYVVNNEPLDLQFSIYTNSTFEMNLIESSFDLMKNSELKIQKRTNSMMPRPFAITDAIILKAKIIPPAVVSKIEKNSPSFVPIENASISNDSIKPNMENAAN